jgi:Hg(II)-responsive transcriptional regulator
MTRSEVADRANINPETVRYYERRGLMPDPPRTSAGYRQYDASHVDRLQFIKRAQELGFTLSEIEDLLGLRVASGTHCDEVRAQVETKIEDVEAKIRDLHRIHDALGDLIDACQQQKTTGPCPILKAMDDDAVFAQVTATSDETPA